VASDSLLIQLEDRIVRTLESIDSLSRCLRCTEAADIIAPRGRQSDLWGTIMTNLSVLASRSSDLVDRIADRRAGGPAPLRDMQFHPAPGFRTPKFIPVDGTQDSTQCDGPKST